MRTLILGKEIDDASTFIDLLQRDHRSMSRTNQVNADAMWNVLDSETLRGMWSVLATWGFRHT